MRDGDLQHPASYEGYLREAHSVFLNIDCEAIADIRADHRLVAL